MSLIWDLVLFLFASAIFGLGVCQIVFELAVLSAFEKHTGDGQVMNWPEHSPNGTSKELAAEPEYLITGPTAALIAEGALSIVVAVPFLLSIMAHLFKVFRRSENAVSKTIKSQQLSLKFRQSMLDCVVSTLPPLATVGYSTVTLALLIYVFVVEGQSNRWQYTDIGSVPNQFTRESWACQMREQYTSKKYQWFESACEHAVSERHTHGSSST